MTTNTERDALAAAIRARHFKVDGPADDEDQSIADAVLAWLRENGYEKREPVECICTPAIAGISDGPNIGCPEHGEREPVAGQDGNVKTSLGLKSEGGEYQTEREPVVVDDAMVKRFADEVFHAGLRSPESTLAVIAFKKTLAALAPDGEEAVIRCDYCGDALPSVASRADIPTTPDLQRRGFAADKIVCPECAARPVVDDATEWEYSVRPKDDGVVLGIEPMPLESARTRANNLRGGWVIVRRRMAGPWEDAPVPYWCPRCGETVPSDRFAEHRLTECAALTPDGQEGER